GGTSITPIARPGSLMHCDLDVRGGPAALVPAATVSRRVVHLRAKDVLAWRVKSRRCHGLAEHGWIALRIEREPLLGDGHPARRPVFLPVDDDVRRRILSLSTLLDVPVDYLAAHDGDRWRRRPPGAAAERCELGGGVLVRCRSIRRP